MSNNLRQIKEGYKQTKVGVIPEDWEVVKIGDVFNIKVGKDLDEKNYSQNKTEEHIYPIYSNTVDNRGLYGYSKIIEYQNNSLTVVGRGIGLGTAFSRHNSFCAIGRLLVLQPKFNSNVDFITEYINFKMKIFDESSGIPQLTGISFSTYLIPLPQLKEQEKIAEILTTWDDAIELQENLIDEKETLKKGLMQKLLSGEVRFREFTDKWKETKLGEVIKLQGGYAFKNKEFKKSGIPIVRISNISNTSNYMEMNDLVYYNELSNDNNFIIKKNDLLIAMSGATTGKVSIYNLEQKAYLNQRVGLFKSLKPSLIDYGFLIQFVFSNIFSSQLTSLLVAGAQPNISSKDIESLKIKLPSLQEQQKIAEVLSLADNEIELLKNELDELKLQKKGLMQKLLTGKVRVKI